MSISFPRLFFTLATAIALVFILVTAKAVLFPLALGLLIAFILLPMASKIESWGLGRVASTVLTLCIVTFILIGIVFFFSSNMATAIENLNTAQTDMGRYFSQTILWINEHVPFLPDMTHDEALTSLEEKFKEQSGAILGSSLSGTSGVLTGAVSAFIFTFFFLLYRRGLVNSMVAFSEKENRPSMRKMYREIQQVGQKYLGGMAKLILLLGILNSIGLLIIGVENPFLFGFMAASLSIIPYVGTTVGAVIPVVFTFVSQDATWMPLAVMGWFGFVQFLEGNFLSPVIVGTSVDLNALVAFLSLLSGAAIWGVGGMIIFLPYVAMLKVVANRFTELEPLAHILSDKPYGDFKEDEKPSLLDRIKSIFKE